VTIVNEWLGLAFDVLLYPFRQLSPIVGLSVASLLTAAAMLLVFRATSDQRRIEQVKRAMVAALFEIRLFNDDLPALFRAQGEMLRQNAAYVRLSLVPMLWMIVPIVLVVAQLEFRYGYAGLTPGQSVLVKAQLRHAPATNTDAAPAAGEASSAPAATLEAPNEVRVLTSAVWFPATQEVVWQVTPNTPGEFVLNARIGSGTFTKTLEATDHVVRRSPLRVSPGLVDQFLYPAEPPLPVSADVASISVAYPARAIRILGWDMPWIVVYFGLSMAFALLLRKPLGVTL
jgi:uncharacterized membrane protein (DUF106 family)